MKLTYTAYESMAVPYVEKERFVFSELGDETETAYWIGVLRFVPHVPRYPCRPCRLDVELTP